MKKYACIVLSVLLTVCSFSAMAAGRLNVLQENYHFVGGFLRYAYAFAKVENSGDRPIKVNAGVFEVYDADGEVITSSDYENAYATYLQPGEYTYVRMYADIDEGKTPDDYMMTLTGKSDNSEIAYRLPVESSFKMNVKDGWWEHNYLYALISNPTDNVIYSAEVVFALLDAEGNILTIESKSLYSEVGIMPSSNVMIRLDISSSTIDYFDANGMVPASVDAIAYVMLEND